MVAAAPVQGAGRGALDDLLIPVQGRFGRAPFAPPVRPLFPPPPIIAPPASAPPAGDAGPSEPNEGDRPGRVQPRQPPLGPGPGEAPAIQSLSVDRHPNVGALLDTQRGTVTLGWIDHDGARRTVMLTRDRAPTSENDWPALRDRDGNAVANSNGQRVTVGVLEAERLGIQQNEWDSAYRAPQPLPPDPDVRSSDGDAEQQEADRCRVPAQDPGRNVPLRDGHPVDASELMRPQPNATYQVNGYAFRTDDQGRTVEAWGELHRGAGGRARGTPPGLQPGDDRGHLVARRFDGPGELINIAPTNLSLNEAN